MVNVIPALGNYFAKDIIQSYCNDHTIDNTDELKAEIEDSIYKLNRELTNYNSPEQLQLGYDIKENDNTITNIYITFSFKGGNGTPEKYTITVCKMGFSKFKQDFENAAKLIVEGLGIVSEVNEYIKEIQREVGASVAIEYRWSITEKMCSISDWDYNRLKIKLNRSSISSLIDLKGKDELRQLIQEANWALPITEFIEAFNSVELHRKIGAILKLIDTESILTENMLSVDDIIAIIRRNREYKGKQNLKSVTVVKELGRFIAISKWAVDYSNKALSMKIMDDKILDLDNGRFISDNSIYSKLEQKVILPASAIEMIFTE